MPNSRPLTLATLRANGACFQQLTLFEQQFGDSVVITEDTAVECVRVLNVNWAAAHLLSPEAKSAYTTAKKRADIGYETAWIQASAAYNAARTCALASYDPEVAQRRTIYAAAITQAMTAYNAVMLPAGATYALTVARAWARAYINDGETR